jgi:hypothetical protein
MSASNVVAMFLEAVFVAIQWRRVREAEARHIRRDEVRRIRQQGHEIAEGVRRGWLTVQEKHGWQGGLAGFAEHIESTGRNRPMACLAGADRHGRISFRGQLASVALEVAERANVIGKITHRSASPIIGASVLTNSVRTDWGMLSKQAVPQTPFRNCRCPSSRFPLSNVRWQTDRRTVNEVD